MSEFKWGIIGTGGIARAFATDVALLDDHVIAAVGSRDLQTARTFAADYYGARAYGSYKELINDPRIDAVYVATPHPMHKENVIAALNAGKPVLCEKPFAVNSIEAKEMVAAAKANDVALMEAMWSRFLPHYSKIREIVASRVLGQITTVLANHGQRLADQNIPRLVEPSLAGGALLDLGIYPVSFAHMVLGVPQSIHAKGVITQKGVDAQSSMILNYANGAQAVLNTTMMVKTPCTAVIAGINGYLEVDTTFYNPTSMRIKLYDGTVTEFPNEYIGHGLREQAHEFARIVKSGAKESPLLKLEDTLAIMKILDTVRDQIGLKYPFES
jgi:predicted dehydrogenase